MHYHMNYIKPAVSGGNITYVGGDATTSGGVSSLGLTLPTHATDDFAVIYGYGDAGTATISITVATGWTELVQEQHTVNRARRNAIFYKKLTSASETNPTVSFSASDQWGASVHIFRGVHTTDPFDGNGADYTTNNNADDNNPTPQAITTDSAGSAILLLLGLTSSEISAGGAPSGYTLGENSFGANRNVVGAYLLDAGAAGAKSPGVWTNTASGSTADYSQYSIALRST